MLHLLFWIPKPQKTELAMLTILVGLLSDVVTSNTCSDAPVAPLHLAVMNGRLDAVRRLLDYGADSLAVLEKDIMPSITRSGTFSTWGVKRHHACAADFMQIYSQQTTKAIKVPTVPVSLQGCTAAGIVFLRSDMFLPHEIETMLELLLPLGPAPGRKDMFHVRPEGEHTFLQLLAASTLRLNTELLGRVLRAGKRAGLDVCDGDGDGDGDTPMHNACVAFGDTSEREILLHEVINGNFTEAGANKKNNMGLTPMDMRFWSFINGDIQAEAAVEVHIGRPEKQSKRRDGKATRNEKATKKLDNNPRLSGGRMEHFWWEMEKGMHVQCVSDAQGRKMIDQYRGGAVVFLRNLGASVAIPYDREYGYYPVPATMTVDIGQV